MASTTAAATNAARSATIPYLSASTQHSLYRNGKAFEQRDQDGSDAPWVGADLENRFMPMTDAQQLVAAQQPRLKAHGFELCARRLADPELDFLDHEQVVRRYYPDCAALVREATGARFVAAFDHNVRSAAGKNSKRRIAEQPVATHPIGFCYAAGVVPEDLVVFEIRYRDRTGENYLSKHAERHQWYFCPTLTRDEGLLIKQWDSAGELARINGANGDVVGAGLPSTFSFQTAFEDPQTPADALDR